MCVCVCVCAETDTWYMSFALSVNSAAVCVSKQPSACQDPCLVFEAWPCGGHANMCTCMLIWVWTYIALCACVRWWKFLLVFCLCVEVASAGSSYSPWWLGWLTNHICFQSKQKQCRSSPKTTGTWWLSFNFIIPPYSMCMWGPCVCVFLPCVFFSAFEGDCA